MLGKLGKLAKLPEIYSGFIQNPKKSVRKITGRQGKGLLGKASSSVKKLGSVFQGNPDSVIAEPNQTDRIPFLQKSGVQKALTIFKWIVIIVLLILLIIALIPIVPYWMITYYSFWGRYGILRLARNNFRNF